MTDIETVTDIPYKSVERYIKTLKDKGIIERKGSKKTGGYYLCEEVKKKLAEEESGEGKTSGGDK